MAQMTSLLTRLRGDFASPSPAVHDDVEMGNVQDRGAMTAGQRHFKHAQDMLASVRREVRELEDRYEDSKSAVTEWAARKYKDDIQAQAAKILGTAKLVGEALDRIEKQTAQAIAKGDLQPGTSEAQFFQTQVFSKRKALRDIVQSVFELRVRMEKEHRDQVSRRLAAVMGKDPTPEQVDTVMESGNANSIFQMEMMEGRERVLQTLHDMKERRSQFWQLLSSLEEVVQLYDALAALVSEQGETLDKIELALEETTQTMVKGNKHLQDANAKLKDKRKCQLITALVVALLVVLLIIILVLTIRPLIPQ